MTLLKEKRKKRSVPKSSSISSFRSYMLSQTIEILCIDPQMYLNLKLIFQNAVHFIHCYLKKYISDTLSVLKKCLTEWINIIRLCFI